MSSHFTPFTLKDISRPGGGFAMLAVDQREAMPDVCGSRAAKTHRRQCTHRF